MRINRGRKRPLHFGAQARRSAPAAIYPRFFSAGNIKVWFRAVFEISSRRNGISAKELQRIMGFGSYKTAWTWLHKLRAAMVRPDRQPL